MTTPQFDVQSSPLPDFSSRLVTLCDGRPGLRGGLHVDIREPGPSLAAPKPGEGGSPILDFVSSDETLDRYGEIITAGGWRLENYRRNPVFQNAHQYGDIIFTLGRALITEVRAADASARHPYLFQRVEFATDVNPLARIAYGLYKGKFLNAVSVGFIPLRWEDGAPDGPPSAGGRNLRRKYLEQELLEVSAVGIPANPNALALGLKAGAVEKADVRDVLEMLREMFSSGAGAPPVSLSPLASQANFPKQAGRLPHYPEHEFCSSPAVPNTHARASGVRNYEAQLLQLGRAMREALK